MVFIHLSPRFGRAPFPMCATHLLGFRNLQKSFVLSLVSSDGRREDWKPLVQLVLLFLKASWLLPITNTSTGERRQFVYGAMEFQCLLLSCALRALSSSAETSFNIVLPSTCFVSLWGILWTSFVIDWSLMCPPCLMALCYAVAECLDSLVFKCLFPKSWSHRMKETAKENLCCVYSALDLVLSSSTRDPTGIRFVLDFFPFPWVL